MLTTSVRCRCNFCMSSSKPLPQLQLWACSCLEEERLGRERLEQRTPPRALADGGSTTQTQQRNRRGSMSGDDSPGARAALE